MGWRVMHIVFSVVVAPAPGFEMVATVVVVVEEEEEEDLLGVRVQCTVF